MPWPMRFGPPPRMMTFLASDGLRLVGGLAGEGSGIGRVHVGGRRGELGRAGVDALEDRAHGESAAQLAHLGLGLVREHGEAGIGEAERLDLAEGAGRLRQAVGLHLGFHVDDVLELLQEPAVDLAGGIDLVVADAEAQGLGHFQDPVRGRRADGRLDGVAVVALAEALDIDLVEAGEAGLQRAQRLLQGFREGAADGHGLAHGLHRRGQRRLGAGEFFEGEARDLGDHVVDGRLEGGRRRAAGDVVGDLVEGVADGELGRDLGDREAGRLRGQSGGARHARVHLDHDHAPGFRVDRELHVRAAGLDADLTQHRQRGVAHDLVFLVGQRQGRRHGDGIAGMHAHRVEVLDGADDDAVVRLVADDLHLVLLPAEHALLDQHLVGGGGVEAPLHDVEELLAVIGDAAAGAAHGEGRADDRGQAHLGERDQGLAHGVLLVALAAVVLAGVPFQLVARDHPLLVAGMHVEGLEPGELGEIGVPVGLLQGRGVGQARFRRVEADLGHGLAEELAVLGLVDGLRRRADHLDVELLQHAHLLERQGAVERRLAAHGGQDRVGALLLDDLGDDLGGDRLHVGGIREIGIGHDRRRVRIHQDDAVAFLLQGLHGLCARIIELAGLADDDRSGADDENGGDVCPLWHWATQACPAARP